MAILSESWVQDALLLITSVLVLCHWYISSSYNFFRDQGIPYLRPWPFVGLWASWSKSQHDLSIMLHNSYPEERFFGYFQSKTPFLVVKDPELLRDIMIKDFASFHDHGFPYNEDDPLSNNLFNVKGDVWRLLRLKLIPTFTTGKLKNMFDQLVACGDKMIESVGSSGDTVNARLFALDFSSEVIGNITFGLDFNKDSPEGKEFTKKIQEVFSFSIRQLIVFFLMMTNTKLLKTFNIKTFNPEATKYFIDLIKANKDYRKNNPNSRRNDYFQLLLSLQEAEEKGKTTSIIKNDDYEEDQDTLIDQMKFVPKDIQLEDKKLFTDECLAAQSFVFFSGGSESVSGTMGFVLYHVAKDRKIQDRLVDEIKAVLEKHNVWCYQCVKEMTYMDQVIQETQRMYPVLSFLMRECTSPYQIPNSNTVLEKGTKIMIPIAGIQMDPKYYSSPEQFNPDRFLDNNHKPNPTFMPFGDGPRICIAMRFAILEMKVGLAMILQQFSISLNSNTKEPFQFERKSFFPRPVGGIWIDLIKR